MATTATLRFENWDQPDEGYPWNNTASFLSEDEAVRAARALVAAKVAAFAVVEVEDENGKVAQLEFSPRGELEVFDNRKKSAFSL